MSYWTPQPMYPSGEPALFTIGDITCTQNYVIVPTGRYQLRGTTWAVNNQVYTTQSVSTVGVVLAILGFLFVCVLSLLFLLMKETRYHGFIDVTVTGMDGLHHTTRLMANDQVTAHWVQQQVAYAQSLAMSA